VSGQDRGTRGEASSCEITSECRGVPVHAEKVDGIGGIQTERQKSRSVTRENRLAEASHERIEVAVTAIEIVRETVQGRRAQVCLVPKIECRTHRRTRARPDCQGIAGQGIECGDADDSAGRAAVGVEENRGRRSTAHPEEGQRQTRDRDEFSHYTLRFLLFDASVSFKGGQ
jgi:hypothetical protein